MEKTSTHGGARPGAGRPPRNLYRNKAYSLTIETLHSHLNRDALEQQLPEYSHLEIVLVEEYVAQLIDQLERKLQTR